MPNHVGPSSDEVDLLGRDPHDLNSEVKVEFDDIFGEPDGARSPNCVWRNSKVCFTCSKGCCYAFLTGLCSILTACCFGLKFACCACCIIWDHMPCFKLYTMCCGCIRGYWDNCVYCPCATCCANCGYMYSKIVVIIRGEDS